MSTKQAERTTQLHHRSQSSESGPEIESTLSARFEQIVQLYGRRTAVKSRQAVVSYDDLNAWANAIANRLLQYADAGGKPIVLFFEQGAEAIASLLGVLKSGNFYVPIDPMYPDARNTQILQDIDASILLTNSTNRSAAVKLALAGQEVVNIDRLPKCRTNPQAMARPDSLAYVLYTSGSSGEPKGVMQTHRNVLCDILRQNTDLATTVDDRYGLLFSTCSSASVCHIFGALLSGASVLPFDIREHGFYRLSEWMVDEGITILDINVTTFRHWCRTLPAAEGFPALRLLAPGSEPVYSDDVELYKRHFSRNCIMQNALGTTETRTVTQFFIDKSTKIDTGLVPVGSAVARKGFLLADDASREVLPGEVGEIVVIGDFLSPGYWRRPEQTAAVFKARPNAETCYRTGDLGRVDRDGNLVHLGRKDFQVKIRGFRVEISEVEMALSKIASVTDSAVAAHDDGNGGSLLVGYVVVEANAIPSLKSLRIELAKQLPEYAIPGRFEFLQSLPLTLNGKLDRRALPKPPDVYKLSAEHYVSPAGTTEQEVARLFEEVLGAEPVGRDDDFFALGGHSLLAALLVLRIEEALGIALPASAVLESPTVAEIAELLDPTLSAVWPSAIVLQAGTPGRLPLFCLPGAAGNSIQFRRLVQHIEPDQPVYGIDPRGVDGREKPHATIEAMAQAYLLEITALEPVGPYLLCGFSLGGIVAYEVGRLLTSQGKDVALLALIDSQISPFAVRTGPRVLRDRIAAFRHDLANAPSTVRRTQLIARKLRRMARPIKPFVTKCRFSIYRAIGKSAPRRVRDSYLQAVHWRAGAQYPPGPYGGTVTYFRAVPAPQSQDLQWQRFAAQVDIVEIAGTHDDLIAEPFVEELARHLQTRLTAVADRHRAAR